MNGVSTRNVDALVVALGGTGISKSEVSRICGQLDEEVGRFRTRRLDAVEYPYVFLDATYLHVRTDHLVTSMAVVVAPRWPPTAAAKSSGWTWVTVRTRCSGVGSSPA